MRRKRILFLMHEGIQSTIFQSQVAMHASEMREHGYDVDVWVFETTIKSFKNSQRNLASVRKLFNCEVRLLRGLYVFAPLSAPVNAALLLWHLLRADDRYDLVHARTDYSASVYSFIRGWLRVPMLWDCRGDTYAEINQALSQKRHIPRLVKATILRAIKLQTIRAGVGCTGASFVSKGLLARKAKAINSKPRFVIPCAVSSQSFYFNEALRERYRNQLGYGVTDVVLVYSGSMSNYQGFDKYARLVQRILDSGDSRIKLLVVTPEVQTAQRALSQILPKHAYKVVSATYLEMNAFLNAADYGALLRESDSMNDVSSPTKFGEYCLTGLPVILDGNVRQALEVAIAISSYQSYADVCNGKRLQKLSGLERAAISTRSQRFFSRERLNTEYAAMYSTLIRASRSCDAKGHQRSNAEVVKFPSSTRPVE